MFISNNIIILNSYNINKNDYKYLEDNKNSFINNKENFKIDNYEEYFNIFSDDLDG